MEEYGATAVQDTASLDDYEIDESYAITMENIAYF